ncbi:unnamed protein product [Penicillium camemberti]|uniref:Str. FM013 n=1 Tax=Penicillium camemberti (strain FM 013) TaxID=1429867 RepID=A0A0G4PPL4_PENC3|nr:unnamed protein product [Penicillium camemberti]
MTGATERPCALSDERRHASQMATERASLTARGTDYATSEATMSTTSPQIPISDTRKLITSTSEATLGLNEEATIFTQFPTSQPELPSAPSEPAISLTNSTAALKELPTSQTEPASNAGESATSLGDTTTALDESPSRMEELEEGEIHSTPPSANSTHPPPSPRPFIAPLPLHGCSNGRLGSKRKRASADDELADQSESNKRKSKKEKDDRLPVPRNVRKRLVYLCDASIRLSYGAVGIVWPESLASSKWNGKGLFYPGNVESRTTGLLVRCIHSFAVCCCRHRLARTPFFQQMGWQGGLEP